MNTTTQLAIHTNQFSTAAAISGGEIDYMISAGTAFRAAVRGLPLKIVANSFKQPLFYLLAGQG